MYGRETSVCATSRAAIYLAQGKQEEARKMFEAIVKESPQFKEAHVTLATIYYRLKRKEDGDRERAIVAKLNADEQAKQQKPADAVGSPQAPSKQ